MLRRFFQHRFRDLDTNQLEQRVRFYTVADLGEKRSLTPEGFLICLDVPLARTGEQIYGTLDQLPIAPGPDGKVYIYRTEAEVFRPETIASCNGKCVVDDHPLDDVSPKNFRGLTCGTILYPRRGEGNESDLLLADLIVKDQAMIDDIQAGKRELSLGYDANLIQIGPGKGEQRNIIVNHVALVDRGRCGPRCAIGDAAPRITDHPPPAVPAKVQDCACKEKELPSMSTKTLKARLLDSLKPFFKDKEDEAEKVADAVEAAVKDSGEGGGDGGIHVHLPGASKVNDEEMCSKKAFDDHVEANAAEHKTFADALEEIRGRLDEMAKPSPEAEQKAKDEAEAAEVKDEISEEVPAEVKDEVMKARDSAYLADSFDQTLADAEILVPGIQPARAFALGDAPVRTFKDGICGTRRLALEFYYNSPAGRAFIDQQLQGKTFQIRDSAAMPCKRVTDMFRAAVSHQRTINNNKAGGGAQGGSVPASRVRDMNSPSHGSVPVMSAEALAKQAAAAWDKPKQ